VRGDFLRRDAGQHGDLRGSYRPPVDDRAAGEGRSIQPDPRPEAGGGVGTGASRGIGIQHLAAGHGLLPARFTKDETVAEVEHHRPGNCDAGERTLTGPQFARPLEPDPGVAFRGPRVELVGAPVRQRVIEAPDGAHPPFEHRGSSPLSG
jgi:hypothetical protein